MTKRFLVQFLRMRRGVPEPINSLSFSADSVDDLQAAVRKSGLHIWPPRADSVRVIDYDGGRTVGQWTRRSSELPQLERHPDLKRRGVRAEGSPEGFVRRS